MLDQIWWPYAYVTFEYISLIFTPFKLNLLSFVNNQARYAATR